MVKKKKKRNYGWKAQIFLILMILCSILFSAVAIIMAVGMIPTLVSAIVDRSEGKIKTMTVGALNFAGCAPFMIEVFIKGNEIGTAVNYVIEPRTIVVIYAAAALGYMVDWAMTGIVSSIMVQKGKSRLKEIHIQQKQLIERWGHEITGEIPLDQYGFALEQAPEKDEKESV